MCLPITVDQGKSDMEWEVGILQDPKRLPRPPIGTMISTDVPGRHASLLQIKTTFCHGGDPPPGLTVGLGILE